MTDHDDPPGTNADQFPARPPRSRPEPAVMRETLDAARRHLGSAEDAAGPAPSAEHQRALLREAAAAHAPGASTVRPEPADAAEEPGDDGEADAGRS